MVEQQTYSLSRAQSVPILFLNKIFYSYLNWYINFILSLFLDSYNWEEFIIFVLQKNKINNYLKYEILDKDTIKFENITLLSATKRGHA